MECHVCFHFIRFFRVLGIISSLNSFSVSLSLLQSTFACRYCLSFYPNIYLDFSLSLHRSFLPLPPFLARCIRVRSSRLIIILLKTVFFPFDGTCLRCTEKNSSSKRIEKLSE